MKFVRTAVALTLASAATVAVSFFASAPAQADTTWPNIIASDTTWPN
ncbi:hypothetical protein J2S40_003925 [Nocardioides luteus]|uniref:ABC transporter substrate-binding protein n=1 Tax=Nocardioides luteus TaxID=1844 RepID=A0ABQ5T1S2_9ACTN|nr:hypothetical protein [Nocardioides luteus]MDR7312867.1 hypothetical protein [Nocardioides luteus]GGR48148.1 hypothetical protein GCM10010197_12570 [Nocardioides luteus]GLJ69121.1 hypothetical protein GCM10017579_31570 [Nocardioides luteus]